MPRVGSRGRSYATFADATGTKNPAIGGVFYLREQLDSIWWAEVYRTIRCRPYGCAVSASSLPGVTVKVTVSVPTSRLTGWVIGGYDRDEQLVR